MAIFQTDEQAWSMFTRQFETRFGGDISPNIIQVNTVLRPLSSRTRWPRLNTFRRLQVADAIPSFSKEISSRYIDTGNRVSVSYDQYAVALNAILRQRYPALNQQEADSKLRAYRRAAQALRDYYRETAEAWRLALRQNPTLTRVQWERESGYREELRIRNGVATAAYSDYRALVDPYPDLYRVSRALRNLDNPVSYNRLPMTEDQALIAETIPMQDAEQAWEEFLTSFIDMSVDDFMAGNAEDSIEINRNSSLSTSYESRWSGSASVGYAFWSVDAGASGGTIDNHLREDAQSLKIKFKKLQAFSVIRGSWFDEGIVTGYCREVSRSDFWTSAGVFNLIPRTVVLGRGVSVEIQTEQRSYDEFRNWYAASASGGFSLGPWRIGGGGSSSSSYTSIRNTSEGTTIKIEDTSEQIYVAAVLSLRPLDVVDDGRFMREIVDREDEEFAMETQKWLNAEGARFEQQAAVKASFEEQGTQSAPVRKVR